MCTRRNRRSCRDQATEPQPTSEWQQGHALGHPDSPAPQTAWELPELAQGGGSTAPAVTAAPAALPPNAPSLPVLAQGTGRRGGQRPHHNVDSTGRRSWTWCGHRFRAAAQRCGNRDLDSRASCSNPDELSDLPSAAAVDVQLQAANASGLSTWSTSATPITGVTSSLPAIGGSLSAGSAAPVRRMLLDVSTDGVAEPASVSISRNSGHTSGGMHTCCTSPVRAAENAKIGKAGFCIGAARLNLTGRRPKLKMARCSGWYSGTLTLFLFLGGLRAFERASVTTIKSLVAWIAALGGISLALLLILSGRGGIALGALTLFGPLIYQRWRAYRMGQGTTRQQQQSAGSSQPPPGVAPAA